MATKNVVCANFDDDGRLQNLGDCSKWTTVLQSIARSAGQTAPAHPAEEVLKEGQPGQDISFIRDDDRGAAEKQLVTQFKDPKTNGPGVLSLTIDDYRKTILESSGSDGNASDFSYEDLAAAKTKYGANLDADDLVAYIMVINHLRNQAAMSAGARHAADPALAPATGAAKVHFSSWDIRPWFCLEHSHLFWLLPSEDDLIKEHQERVGELAQQFIATAAQEGLTQDQALRALPTVLKQNGIKVDEVAMPPLANGKLLLAGALVAFVWFGYKRATRPKVPSTGIELEPPPNPKWWQIGTKLGNWRNQDTRLAREVDHYIAEYNKVKVKVDKGLQNKINIDPLLRARQALAKIRGESLEVWTRDLADRMGLERPPTPPAPTPGP